ncbi:hypothetical protein SAMN04489832_5056 [Micromonospora cremea]|uniref:DUF397 domain-containing protein n=1 Tax=Micromonospora cremea TaxID=709881 RepID=A0A1N6A7M2_9ACTN|nr:hypothetical protein SAMN04489832_5056 [Micromonospora cremea]
MARDPGVIAWETAGGAECLWWKTVRLTSRTDTGEGSVSCPSGELEVQPEAVTAFAKASTGRSARPDRY